MDIGPEWIFVSAGVGLWLVKEQDKYSNTERRVLYTALILAAALGAIGWLNISLKEPYHNVGSKTAGCGKPCRYR